MDKYEKAKMRKKVKKQLILSSVFITTFVVGFVVTRALIKKNSKE